MIANMLRDDTSSRAKVLRSKATLSRTSQSSRELARNTSACRTAAISPSVFRRSNPSSGSLARNIKMASSSSRAMASGHQFCRAILHRFGKICRRYNLVHQAPGSCAFAFHTIWIGAEHVGKIAAHFAFIDYASESAGSRQYTEQRSFRQAHGAGAIVDQQNFVARESQFVATTCGCTVQRGEKLQAVVATGIFHPIAGFVGKFAEIYFPRVRRAGQHINVCARAEHSFFAASNDYARNFRMFESNSLQRVVQLDVDAEVVGIQL